MSTEDNDEIGENEKTMLHSFTRLQSISQRSGEHLGTNARTFQQFRLQTTICMLYCYYCRINGYEDAQLILLVLRRLFRLCCLNFARMLTFANQIPACRSRVCLVLSALCELAVCLLPRPCTMYVPCTMYHDSFHKPVPTRAGFRGARFITDMAALFSHNCLHFVNLTMYYALQVFSIITSTWTGTIIWLNISESWKRVIIPREGRG